MVHDGYAWGVRRLGLELGCQSVVIGQDKKSLDEVFKLPDVPGPIMLDKLIQEFERQLTDLTFIVLPIFRDEVTAQSGDVFPSLPEWRQLNRDDVQAKIQVFSEPAVGDGLVNVDVSGSHDPRIDFQALAASQPREGAILQHVEKLGLQVRAHFSNFVQKKRTGVS